MAGSLILINARVWSPDGAGAGCDAVVAEGARITALTSTGQARAQAGPGARIIDLAGRLVIPAFGDAHVHPVGGGLESLRCNLTGLLTRDEYLRVIADSVRALDLGPGDWVLGGGWSMEAFPGGVPGRGGGGTTGVPAQPGPPQRLGQPGRAGPGGHHRRHPGPGRRPHRAR